jgi:glucosamine--fructose-6-phosphate aminotransferase (isomerizing)
VEEEINEIAGWASLCYERNKGLILPEKVPYVGMGSSYYATLVLRYLSTKIYPELASEYFNYLENVKQFEKAVLISQSGESPETLWCANRFEKFVCIVNNPDSALGNHPGADVRVNLFAGNEKYTSSRSFINTLVTFYLGHGLDPRPAIHQMGKNQSDYRSLGNRWGKEIYSLLKKRKYKGFYILGAGPNAGAAMQASLVLTQSTGCPFHAMPMAQYDHGMKEAAQKSVVFFIKPSGMRDDRTETLIRSVKEAGGVCFSFNEPGVSEQLSPLVSTIPFLYMAAWLRRKMKIKELFISPPIDS